MEYERIDKVQVGAISPSKLRMKLLGAQNLIKKEERNNCNSSRTSPSRVEDYDCEKSSLLGSDVDEEDSKDTTTSEPSVRNVSFNQNADKNLYVKEKENTGNARIISNSTSFVHQGHPSNNSSIRQVSRKVEDEKNGYDSGQDNGSTSSFEFHRGERNLLQHTHAGSRNIPSKWNDAEKWIVSRQMLRFNASKKMASQNSGNRSMISNDLRPAPLCTMVEQKHSMHLAAESKTESAESISRIVVEKFSFLPRSSSLSGSASRMSGLSNQSNISDDCTSTPRLPKQKNHNGSLSQNFISEPKVIPTVQSVSMRDIGTEMTPIASQDPSRTATPIGATTPIRSPMSSIPSTPRRGTLTTSPVQTTVDDELSCRKDVNETHLSEIELQLKTRKEIVALGLQLGKMNIASWASKHEIGHGSPCLETINEDQQMKAEFEARAAAWEEAEKSKHLARFKREEVKIQAWESHQKAKYEAKIRKTEAQVEQMKAHAHGRMIERLAITRQKAEEKHATARVRMSRSVARTDQQVDQIRKTGRTPSAPLRCCSWFL